MCNFGRPHRVPPRDGDDEESLRVAVVVVLIVLALFVGIAVAFEHFFPPTADAYELVISWTPPTYNSGSLDCMQTDTLSLCQDFRSVVLKLVNFAGPDTTTVGEFMADVDSVRVEVPNGMHGEALAWTKDFAGNQTCTPRHSLFTTPAVEPPAPSAGTGLLGRHYTYDRWNDFKTFLGERVDTTINFDWGAGSAWPASGADWWSIKYTGFLTAPYAGTYTFTFEKNDGHRFYIDGTLDQNEWRDMTGETSSSRYLLPGPHPIEIHFYEGYSSAKLKWYWSGPGFTKRIVEKAVLAPN